ncbi:UDP-N-acetylmuramoyl-tripeptide--D-alanyl-D-alanine ligase [Enterococcus sp. LJL98]
MRLTAREIAQALKIVGDYDQSVLTSVEFDSRLVSEGSLFVPLAGVRDGHEFVNESRKQGALATLWSRPLTEAPQEMIVFPVNDVKQAFQTLAVYYKEKIQPQIIAITGSNGKTTTKDMTASVLSQKYRTYKTQGNYNNELGLPYTILHMPEDTEMLVLEMGMDHAGEIAFLSNLAQPDAAAITMIGEAHLENLGSRRGIAQAKMEITQGLKAKGLLLIPASEPLLNAYLPVVSQEVQTFGVENGTIAGEILEETKQQTTFQIAGQVYTIPVLGSYNVTNACIAYGFGKYFGLKEAEIQQGLSEFQLTKNRTEWVKAKNGADVLSDVYNANPTAMGLVLESFGQLDLPGRRFAVLADMLELGPDSKAMHEAMAEHMNERYDGVFLFGSEMAALYEKLKNRSFDVHYFPVAEKPALIATLQATLQPNDSVLLKGSNGMGLTEIVQEL